MTNGYIPALVTKLCDAGEGRAEKWVIETEINGVPCWKYVEGEWTPIPGPTNAQALRR